MQMRFLKKHIILFIGVNIVAPIYAAVKTDLNEYENIISKRPELRKYDMRKYDMSFITHKVIITLSLN